ncbi:hypothetical protein NAF17_00585 [Mucilaginibacter sp. RB4R14]|uniref:hypothetical protein n=1 Tax=Mucilaginibacter aurantiaciroseus TaxID=2949308 RepID=UPI0020915CAF|nr:hypothetical protein [Mucilaginibacter aurantiaciroseus]MCO5934019.1 hypothetical protein [Mucilaginibacter aurantiaciroseus]
MASGFGHESQRGGISNGITGKDESADGSGIDFKNRSKRRRVAMEGAMDSARGLVFACCWCNSMQKPERSK